MIIPVFDIKNNECVSGKSGKRKTYTKLNSVYGENPIEITINLKKSGAKYIYIADLDKIENRGNNSELISEINKILPVILDNGASSIEDILFNKKICAYSILATETMKSIEDTIEIFKELPFEKLIVSIDIKNNELLINNSNIKMNEIISLVNEVKPDYTILLNISQVGTRKGNADKFINEIISKTPYTQHIIAGGLTNKSIKKYKSEGIDNFLIGSILHEGSLFDDYKW
ncbi:MAG: HisA/HisF family protein [Methanosphaera stadtmanae]|nr:HisA/HisF family protein [Methanosphaera stadtmanae]